MKTINTKVCIIGAGPAGITASLYLAKNKIPSIIVEKSEFPRDKVCADSITGNTIRVIRELIPDFTEQLTSEGKISVIKGVRAYTPNNKMVDFPFLSLEEGTDLPSCYAIKRADFDKFLYQQAKSNEFIEIIENFQVNNIENTLNQVKVYNQEKDICIDARLLILASGSNSNLSVKFGSLTKEPEHYAVGVRGYYQDTEGIMENYSELFMTEKLLPGAIYTTKLYDGTVNVNAVMRNDVVKKKNINLKKLFLETLNTHPILKDRFKNAQLISPLKGSGLFLGTRKREISGNNYMMVGDAAGLIDFLSANGIPQAVLSAKIAAEYAIKCITANDYSAEFLKAYNVAVYKRIENYLKTSTLVAPFVGNPLFLKMITWSMNIFASRYGMSPQLRDLMYDHNVGKTLKKPSFYYKLFVGMKNAESIQK